MKKLNFICNGKERYICSKSELKTLVKKQKCFNTVMITPKGVIIEFIN